MRRSDTTLLTSPAVPLTDRRHAPPAMRRHAAITLPAHERHVSTVRHHTAACLDAWRMDEDDQDRTVLIVGELAANAARHGRHDMTVTLVLSGPTLQIQVTDYGGPPRAALERPEEGECGRGLDIVRALAHSVDISTPPHGTRVRAEYRVGSPRPT
ncbi:hypothetical protein GCM10012280_34380 [Wenjunlia tyrosinilytica]|uniref:Histidine kinase/HSP90-like ATPase domain-containing protein n=1 Tax=Wenjunlia tyrosinilytica TaxID=1544741 RepID=A0A918DZ06_9ACTN|nr:hypothetical protein GCM10012280_34380 [Wenjunlia tyrosinilytica]